MAAPNVFMYEGKTNEPCPAASNLWKGNAAEEHWLTIPLSMREKLWLLNVFKGRRWP